VTGINLSGNLLSTPISGIRHDQQAHKKKKLSMKWYIWVLIVVILLPLLRYLYHAIPALAYLRKAKQGDAEAQYQMALRYYFGYGTKRNVSEAALWAQKAAAQGQERARTLVDDISNRTASAPAGDFTEEEAQVIDHTLDTYGRIFTANAPEGGKGYVHPKLISAWKAQALTEYSERLMDGLSNESPSNRSAVIEKAINSQKKAYALHNLPIYLFLLAKNFATADDAAKTKEFSRRFLHSQTEFKPDNVDTIILDHFGFDLLKLVEAAKRNAGSAD
jgi:hypothetical protein